MKKFLTIGAVVFVFVSSAFRIFGCFGWVMDHVVDVPLITLVLSVVVAAVPGLGLYASYTTLADSSIGPLASGLLLAPSAIGEIMAVLGLFSMIAGAVRK